MTKRTVTKKRRASKKAAKPDTIPVNRTLVESMVRELTALSKSVTKVTEQSAEQQRYLAAQRAKAAAEPEPEPHVLTDLVGLLEEAKSHLQAHLGVIAREYASDGELEDLRDLLQAISSLDAAIESEVPSALADIQGKPKPESAVSS